MISLPAVKIHLRHGSSARQNKALLFALVLLSIEWVAGSLPVLALQQAGAPSARERAKEPTDPVEQFYLGVKCFKGDGLPRNLAEAVQWFQKAALQGYGPAQNNLGFMYLHGLGAPKDYAKAFQWFRQAAARGVAGAQYNLGLLYEKGRGRPKDYLHAARWYRHAALQGHAPAQTNLGYMFANGKGVRQNFVQAYLWYALSAVAGNKSAARARDLLAERMLPEQIAEARRLAAEWKESSKKQKPSLAPPLTL